MAVAHWCLSMSGDGQRHGPGWRVASADTGGWTERLDRFDRNIPKLAKMEHAQLHVQGENVCMSEREMKGEENLAASRLDAE